MSCCRGLHTEAEGGERAAEDTLLPGDAGDLHQGCEAGSTQGRNPDYKESPLITLYRVSEHCSLQASTLQLGLSIINQLLIHS